MTSALLALVLLLSAPGVGGEEAREDFFPLLRGEDAGVSRSVGDTSHGFIAGARELRESESIAILDETRARGLVFGSEELIDLIERAGREVHAATGMRLRVGNLGREGGGEIVYSVSHNSGRDADLALCYRDRRGDPVAPRGLERVDRDGRTRSGLRFDAARCWPAVKAITADDRVQYLFVASWIERMLLDHARRSGEPREVIERARAVLRHPRGSAPHDDHFHLRLYCSERDVASGCVDTGHVHTWARDHDRARARALRSARKQLTDASCDARRDALLRLALLEARGDLTAIVDHLDDECAEVRLAAASALGLLGERRHLGLARRRIAREPEPLVRAELAEARRLLRIAPSRRKRALAGSLARVSLAGAWLAEREALDREEPVAHARARLLAAIDATVRVDGLEPVEPLVALLEHPEAEVRARAADALALLSCHRIDGDWASPDADPERLRVAASRWKAWIDRHGLGNRRSLGSRHALAVAGLRQAGFRYDPRIRPSMWELVRALSGPKHLAYNAERLLVRLTHHHRPPWTDDEPCDHWRRWLEENGHGVRPGATVRSVSCVQPQAG